MGYDLYISLWFWHLPIEACHCNTYNSPPNIETMKDYNRIMILDHNEMNDNGHVTNKHGGFSGIYTYIYIYGEYHGQNYEPNWGGGPIG